jgi:hypothetical protein
VLKTAEAIRYLLSGSNTVFDLLIEARAAGRDTCVLWDQWKTVRHAIDHLQLTWPNHKLPPVRAIEYERAQRRIAAS